MQSKEFHSSFGASILKKFGWKEGSGLGKENDGRTACVQIKRREENLGLGAAAGDDNANPWDNWWDALYNKTAENVQLKKRSRPQSSSTSSTSSSSSSSDDSDDEQKPGHRKAATRNASSSAAVPLKGDRQKGKLLRIKLAEEKSRCNQVSVSTEVSAVSTLADSIVKKKKNKSKKHRSNAIR